MYVCRVSRVYSAHVQQDQKARLQYSSSILHRFEEHDRRGAAQVPSHCVPSNQVNLG